MHLDALDEAVRINDLVAVKYALAMARSSSRALSDFFERICDDIENIGWADDRPWADIQRTMNCRRPTTIPVSSEKGMGCQYHLPWLQAAC